MPQELSSSKIAKAIDVDAKIDNIWSIRLIEEFHFTAESAEKLRSRLQTTYKNAYAYCEAYELNEIQAKALAEFEEHGLTRNHLCGRDEFNHMYHYLALEHLLKKNYTIDQAMEELRGLTNIQADGIRYDVPKEELIPLTTMNQIYIIERCYNIGVRAKHLENLGQQFTFFHGDALKDLIKRKDNKLDIPTLINQLNKLTLHQAAVVALHTSFVPTDLIGLSEYQTMCVEIIFKNKGLKINPQFLLEREWTTTKNKYSQIFTALMSYGEKSITEASQLVEKLIADDLKQKDVIVSKNDANASMNF